VIARRQPLRRSSKPIPRTAAGKGKRTPKRRKKRLSLSKRADALWSQIVKLPGRCEMTGATTGLQAAHGFSRKYRGTRWLPINGFCLSAAAHLTMTYDPIRWDDWIRERWGQPVYDELRALALKTAKPDLPAIVASLEEELKRRTQ
jgi:hypothetical protein